LGLGGGASGRDGADDCDEVHAGELGGGAAGVLAGGVAAATWAQSIAMFERYQLVDRRLNAAEGVDYGVLQRLYGK
jgi:hypothetical protein